MVLTALIIFILHEVEIPVDNIAALNLNSASLPPPVKCVKGVLEEECQEAVSPGVSPEQVEYAETRTAVADPGQELKLERGLERKLNSAHSSLNRITQYLAVKLALNVVLQHKLC